MGLSEKAKEYLKYKQEHDELKQFLPHNAGQTSDFLLRGYTFSEYVSGREKEKENLEILKEW
ncbi:MAG: hypothetical protein LBO65_00895 [Spirochaetaceae bacterium]|nr:hypothetical protein [Spirochaetaceae bacterium]